VADTVTPQPVLTVLPMMDEPPAGRSTVVGPDGALIVVLVDVRDPGNAGTVLRTADASGSALVVFSGESVDPYNPKTVRASAGSLFHVPFSVRRPIPGRPGHRRWPGRAIAPWPPWCGTARTTPARLVVPTALFLGNESAGLRPR
jgi:TrmH family RNA methyltransferase